MMNLRAIVAPHVVSFGRPMPQVTPPTYRKLAQAASLPMPQRHDGWRTNYTAKTPEKALKLVRQYAFTSHELFDTSLHEPDQ